MTHLTPFGQKMRKDTSRVGVSITVEHTVIRRVMTASVFPLHENLLVRSQKELSTLTLGGGIVDYFKPAS